MAHNNPPAQYSYKVFGQEAVPQKYKNIKAKISRKKGTDRQKV